MLRVDEWIAIREQARRGVSVSEIARQSGRDRKTVRKVLRESAPQVERVTTTRRASKLDPYRDYLARRVGQGCLNSAVLLHELAGLGYGGKGSILRAYLAPIRRELRREREATERFETEPGEQAQVDWGDFGVGWVAEEARWRKLYGFVYTLGYSRAQYLEFAASCDMEHFLACHVGAFAALGIARTVLYDNLKTGILGRGPDGAPILPGRFLDFALYYGVTPRYCRPYRARTKGKVERGIGYVRQNFWVRVQHEVATGQLDLAGLNARAADWTATVANLRVHGTHGEVVAARYATEAPHLGRLAGQPPYDTAYRSYRRAGRDGRLSYRGQLYQLPLAHALTTVTVREEVAGPITILAPDGRVVRAHQVTSDGAGRPATTAAAVALESPGAAAPSLTRAGTPVVERRDLAIYEEVARAAGGA